MLQEFHFSTGVLPYSFSFFRPLTNDEYIDNNGVLIIKFYCEDVPEGYNFKFGAVSDNCPEAKSPNWIVRPIVGGGLLSKYAYFQKVN